MHTGTNIYCFNISFSGYYADKTRRPTFTTALLHSQAYRDNEAVLAAGARGSDDFRRDHGHFD